MRLIIIVLTVIQLFTQYTISNPRIVLHEQKHMVQVKWYQYVQPGSELVTAFKLTDIRQSNAKPCVDVDWSTYLISAENKKYCYLLYSQRETKDRWITVTDRNWHKGEQYYLMQYEYSTHNAPYGPFVPK